MQRTKAILGAVAATFATLAGLDVTGLLAIPFLPPVVASWLVVVPSGAAVIVHVAEAVLAQLERREDAEIEAMLRHHHRKP